MVLRSNTYLVEIAKRCPTLLMLLSLSRSEAQLPYCVISTLLHCPALCRHEADFLTSFSAPTKEIPEALYSSSLPHPGYQHA